MGDHNNNNNTTMIMTTTTTTMCLMASFPGQPGYRKTSLDLNWQEIMGIWDGIK